VELLGLLYGRVLPNHNIYVTLVIKSVISRMPAAESRVEIKYFKYTFYLKIKHVPIFIIKYFIFGDSQPKHPAPIIPKDGATNKMRLKITKITFMNLNIMDVLLWRGNRSMNIRICLA
jgi:hypothetical protein